MVKGNTLEVKVLDERLRFVTDEDIPQITEIEKELFSEPWSQKSFHEALQRKENIFLCMEENGEIMGYALLYCMLDEGEIPTIATNPKYQRRGVGENLLREAMAQSAACGVERIFLEVRQSNLPALELYKKCGFHIVGERKNFYRFPTEHAYVCAFHRDADTQEDLC